MIYWKQRIPTKYKGVFQYWHSFDEHVVSWLVSAIDWK